MGSPHSPLCSFPPPGQTMLLKVRADALAPQSWAPSMCPSIGVKSITGPAGLRAPPSPQPCLLLTLISSPLLPHRGPSAYRAPFPPVPVVVGMGDTTSGISQWDLPEPGWDIVLPSSCISGGCDHGSCPAAHWKPWVPRGLLTVPCVPFSREWLVYPSLTRPSYPCCEHAL